MSENNKATIRASILIIILVFISLFVKGQIRPYGGLEYYMGYNYLYTYDVSPHPLIQPMSMTNNMRHVIGNVTFGVDIQLGCLKLDTRVETLTAHVKYISFRPIRSSYFVSLAYVEGEFSIKYTHLYVHQLEYPDMLYFGISGNMDKIGIYWKLKTK